VRALAGGQGVTLVCGRFEGVDERAIEARGLEEVSIGDFVMTGGEIAAMALIDAASGLYRASWGMPSRRSRRVSLPDCLSSRSTHARPTGKAEGYPRFSSRAITVASPPGGGNRRRG
jgi:tRNA G37 N-methylase TrmD